MANSVGKPITVSLLGGLDVRHNGKPIGFATKQAALMFAYLAARDGVPETRWRLAGLFWGDRGEDQARGSLRQTLYRIRKELPETEPPILIADARTVAVNAELVQVDIIDLINETADPDQDNSGEFLSGWEGVSTDFDEWLTAMRAKARLAFTSKLARAADAAEKRRDYGEFVAVARTLADLDPYDEHAARQLMTGLAHIGNSNAALDTYRALRARLLNDLQTEPSPDTRTLVRQIETQSGPFSEREREMPGTAGPLEDRFEDQHIAEKRLVSVLAVQVQRPETDNPDAPETILDLVQSLREPFDSTVRRFGGRMDRAPGLTCLCWFGWPIGGEHATDNAIQAALALRRLANCRIGVATGEVLITPGQGPIGLPPDIAMELMTKSAPGEITIGQQTRDLLGSGYEAKPAESDPTIFHLAAATAPNGRFGARHADGASDLIGRRHERDLLIEKLALADQGEGQLIVVTGEPGIGKSHLQEEVARIAKSDDARRILLQCSPNDTGSPFKPLLDHIRSDAKLSAGTDPEMIGRRLGAHLQESGLTDPRHVRAILQLMDVDDHADADRNDKGLPRHAARAELMQAVAAYILNEAGQRLTFVVLEDAHWADPSTLELMSTLSAGIFDQRLFLLITARPGFDPDSLPDQNRLTLSLTGLSRADIRKLIRQTAGAAQLPETTINDIAARADGIPLFTEELVRSAIRGISPYTEAGFAGRSSTPFSLRSALEARLDALGQSKGVAQRAACIGRVFDRYALLAACAGDNADTEAALGEMLETRLVFRHPGPGTEAYAFRHALICETAYESLSGPDRRKVHGKLFTYFSRQPDTAPEIVARHAALAERHTEALAILKECGEQAFAKYAHKESSLHFQKALEQISFVPFTEQAEDDRLEITGRLCLCHALSQGYGHPDTIARLEEAQRLAISRPASRFTIPVLWQTYSLHYTHAEGDRTCEVGQQILSLEKWDDDYGPQETVGNRFIAAGEMINGRFRAADRLFAAAWDVLYTPGSPNSVKAIGVDQVIPSGLLHARVMAILGHEDKARERVDEVLELAMARKVVHSQIVANVLAAHVMLILNDFQRSGELAESALFISSREETTMWGGYSDCILGIVDLREGAAASGPDRFEKGRSVLRASQTIATTTYLDAAYADALALRGKSEQAGEIFQSVAKAMKAGVEPWCHAEAMRLDAQNAECTGRFSPTETEKLFARARDLAQRQEARLWLQRLNRKIPA